MSKVVMILASASPARLQTLRDAGIEPRVVVSGVDESRVTTPDAAQLAAELAELKGRAVATQVLAEPAEAADTVVLVACDSVLEYDGKVFGKPASAEEAVARWHRMRGGIGILHTGHFVLELTSGRSLLRTAHTLVRFGRPSDREIEDYVATGEPLQVAGAFTIDGLGGPFIDGLEGDPHNVVGLSLPGLRAMLGELGISWTDLWS